MLQIDDPVGHFDSFRFQKPDLAVLSPKCKGRRDRTEAVHDPVARNSIRIRIDMQRIADGIELEDGPIHADAISYATETDRNQAGIEIHSGRNRIVRRLFESLGYHVTKLDRVYFAGLTKKNLPRGRWRYLTQEEVNYLKMGSFE